LVGYVMDAIYGEHRRIHCLNLAELRAHWSEQKGKPVLITSDRPDTALSYLLTTSGFPMLAFFDDPFEAIAYPVIFNNLPLPEAIRFCSQNFSCLGSCAGSEHVQIFDGGHYKASLAETVEAICTAIGAEPSALLTTSVVERLISEEGIAADATVEDVVRRRMNGETLPNLANSRFDAADRALIDWFAADYGPILMSRKADVRWPREFFFVGANGETGEKVVDLIGRARHIVWGPYLNLPIGAWRAHVQFEVGGNLSGNEIEGDVWMPAVQKQIAKCIAKLPVQGYFQFTLEFVNTDPNAPLEIRIRLRQGAIEGHFALRRVTLERAARLGDLVTSSAQNRLQALQELLNQNESSSGFAGVTIEA
jgi:hypothetical protein